MNKSINKSSCNLLQEWHEFFFSRLIEGTCMSVSTWWMTQTTIFRIVKLTFCGPEDLSFEFSSLSFAIWACLLLILWFLLGQATLPGAPGAGIDACSRQSGSMFEVKMPYILLICLDFSRITTGLLALLKYYVCPGLDTFMEEGKKIGENTPYEQRKCLWGLKDRSWELRYGTYSCGAPAAPHPLVPFEDGLEVDEWVDLVADFSNAWLVYVSAYKSRFQPGRKDGAHGEDRRATWAEVCDQSQGLTVASGSLRCESEPSVQTCSWNLLFLRIPWSCLI